MASGLCCVFLSLRLWVQGAPGPCAAGGRLGSDPGRGGMGGNGDGVQLWGRASDPSALLAVDPPPARSNPLCFLGRLVRGAGAKQRLLGNQRNKAGGEGGRGEHIGGG